MRILYLSRNMAGYKSAMYQRDVMEELARQAEVFFYGPGFKNFDPDYSITEVLTKIVSSVDLVLVGHGWLSDADGRPVDPFPVLHLEACSVPKAVILNKEYVNREAKLNWIREKGFIRGFSHHHDVESFSSQTGVPFTFWPFAFNHHLFLQETCFSKNVDFAFSGILQNRNRDAGQSDIRVRIMNLLYVCFGDIPLSPRKAYRQYQMCWNAIPRSPLQARLAVVLKRHRHMLDTEYRDLQRRTRIYLNTLSPAGLVSPRFAENMASKAMVLCEKSAHVSRIFPEDCFVTIEPDLSDFDEKLTYYLANESERIAIVNRAHEEAYLHHTWQKRVESMLLQLKNDLAAFGKIDKKKCAIVNNSC